VRITTQADLDKAREAGLRSLYPDGLTVRVGMGSCGLAAGAQRVYDAVVREAEARGVDLEMRRTGCIGYCEEEPLLDIFRPGWPRLIYARMTAEKAGALVRDLDSGRVRKDWVLCKLDEEEYLNLEQIRTYPTNGVPAEINEIRRYQEVPFFAKQRKIVLRNCGFIDPTNIDEHIARGGYRALGIALGRRPEQIIEEIKESGLRGRGGAGFPTGSKWAACREADGDVKYVVCNADEGDPGAYMDRSVLEGDPYSVLEGMVIGGYAIGANQGYIYVRAEYPLAVETLEKAIRTAEQRGLLGKDIMGSGFDFTIELVRGAGAFVCGEETALLASIEGRIGEPRQRPPYPAQKGLWDKPTCINNVKTWVNIPAVIARGASWFASLGTERSKGTMVFSLVGKAKNTGLVEAPMGMSLLELIYDIGGGIAGDRRFKAVQTGGPSGGCIPAELANLSVDYEELTEAGSMMGSGGMVVMDEHTCMVDVARYFLTFTKDESCGKCTPCREGTRRMLDILNRICAGQGEEGDIELLENLGKIIKKTSLCGLGQTAPNPVLTTIHYFRDEYESHIRHKQCPAIVCEDIVRAPCKYNCPVGTDVPAFVALTAAGRYSDAFDVISRDNPLPVTCSYVCHFPCEAGCREGDIAEPVNVKALRRFVSDKQLEKGIRPRPRPSAPTLGKVAVVGSGPAGLAAAYNLTGYGYKVTVFEKSSVAGGMLTAAMPRFRLPKRIVEAEVNEIKKAGVTIQTNVEVGRDITIDQLFGQGYKAVFLALGAHRSLKLGIPGEDAQGTLDALDLLKAANTGEKIAVGEKVAVVGGGPADVDAARTACRLGSKEVTIIYKGTKEELTALPREIDAALEEGVRMEFLTWPTAVVCEEGKVVGLECVRMKLGEMDSSTGRRRPMPIPDSTFVVPVDIVIWAVGHQTNLSCIEGGDGIQASRRGVIDVDPETLATGRLGVFAGGDAVTGPSTIAGSISQGKLAAESIHRYLRGESLMRDYAVEPPSQYVEPLDLSDEELTRLEQLRRCQTPRVPIEHRVACFDTVEGCLSEEAARDEAKRCLRCHLYDKST